MASKEMKEMTHWIKILTDDANCLIEYEISYLNFRLELNTEKRKENLPENRTTIIILLLFVLVAVIYSLVVHFNLTETLLLVLLATTFPFDRLVVPTLLFYFNRKILLKRINKLMLKRNQT